MTIPDRETRELVARLVDALEDADNIVRGTGRLVPLSRDRLKADGRAQLREWRDHDERLRQGMIQLARSRAMRV